MTNHKIHDAIIYSNILWPIIRFMMQLSIRIFCFTLSIWDKAQPQLEWNTCCLRGRHQWWIYRTGFWVILHLENPHSAPTPGLWISNLIWFCPIMLHNFSTSYKELEQPNRAHFRSWFPTLNFWKCIHNKQMVIRKLVIVQIWKCNGCVQKIKKALHGINGNKSLTTWARLLISNLLP